jgi:DNA repair protein RadA/Sms
MARKTSQFVCQQCGYVSPSFLGRCPECGTWSSIVEEISENPATTAKGKLRHISNSEVINTSDIEKKDFERISTTLKEFDRVLGGGIVYGSVVLLSGDPGIGKSTLLSQLAINVNQSSSLSRQSSDKKLEKVTDDRRQTTDDSVLYIAGEESAHQIKLRIERINPQASLAILNETDVDAVVEAIQKYKPKLVIIDSIQTME